MQVSSEYVGQVCISRSCRVKVKVTEAKERVCVSGLQVVCIRFKSYLA